MVGRTTAYNAVQRIVGTPTIGTLVNVGTGNPVIYTVPAGKRAFIQAFSTQNVALGANTFQNARITIGGTTVNLRKMVALETNMISENINNLVMNAGDKIDAHGDNAANNGTLAFTLSVQESAV